jgi:hypothetical protein
MKSKSAQLEAELDVLVIGFPIEEDSRDQGRCCFWSRDGYGR